jgi:hypothetical protein
MKNQWVLSHPHKITIKNIALLKLSEASHEKSNLKIISNCFTVGVDAAIAIHGLRT